MYAVFILCGYYNGLKTNSTAVRKNCVTIKEPGPIASEFVQTFQDFGIGRKLIFFSLPPVNFTAENLIVWKILMKI